MDAGDEEAHGTEVALREELRRTRLELKAARDQLSRLTQSDRALREEAEEALRSSEERYRAIVETTAEWIWEIDTHGRHTYTNPAVETLLGYDPEEFLSLDTFDLVHPEDRDEVHARLERLVATKEGWSSWEIRWRHRDGTYRQLESNGRPILGREGELHGFRGADRDVTERRQLQERLVHSQKMEAIGTLAGGVAHDFNNLLVAVLGHAGLLADEVAPPLRESVEEIRKAGERASRLTQQLLAFGRKQLLEPRVLDLNAVVNDVRRLLQRLIQENIELVEQPFREPLAIEADLGQIEQVVINLVTNARDAMPDGGTLTIRTEAVVAGNEHALGLGLSSGGRYALLSVSDTGQGMNAETMARACEPFFTTKEASKGTGLGLATVYGIVKQSGGELRLSSEPGRGTTVEVYMPLCDLSPEIEEPGPSEIQDGGGTILVVEDEAIVASTITEVLDHAGFEVLRAANGPEALELERRQAGDIDLLITDVVMARMNGWELAREFSKRRPEVKVLVISGYPRSEEESDTLPDGADFLKKPFSPGELLARVRGLLHTRAGPE